MAGLPTRKDPSIMSLRMMSVSSSRVVLRPLAFAAAISAPLAAAMFENTTSLPSKSANVLKNDEIASSETLPSCANAVEAASTALRATVATSAGMCRRSPVDWTTTRWSPATNDAASSELTVVTWLPP